jgi:hypothetical protein
MTTRVPLVVAIAALYLLHQDVWFWRTATPLVFGFLPIGLAYHALYCVAAAVLMFALTRLAWPAHLESTDTFATSGAGPGAPASEELGGVQGPPPSKR